MTGWAGRRASECTVALAGLATVVYVSVRWGFWPYPSWSNPTAGVGGTLGCIVIAQTGWVVWKRRR